MAWLMRLMATALQMGGREEYVLPYTNGMTSMQGLRVSMIICANACPKNVFILRRAHPAGHRSS